MKLARRSWGEDWQCTKDWPEDCFVQCGGHGMVFTGAGALEKVLGTTEGALDALSGNMDHYVTAFFEAFPKNPDTFIRGEGATIEEAEQKAWDKFQRQSACDHPEFERRSYRNGLGFCVKCGMSKSAAFEPLERCYMCDAPTYQGQTNDGRWYCKECGDKVPDNLLPDWLLEHRQWKAEAMAAGETFPSDDD